MYGIGICKTALTYLSTDFDIDSRLVKAFAELRVMKVKEDIAIDLYNEFNAMVEMYESKERKIDSSSSKDFAYGLVSLCVRIIEHNTLTEKERLARLQLVQKRK